MSDDASLADVLERVGAVEGRIRSLVEARRAVDPLPDDPFRGLYLTEDAVDRILESETDLREGSAILPLSDGDEEPANGLRIDQLRRTFGLTPLDVELLLTALAGDIDRRFESLFGYLNDDVTRRRPSAGLALTLCGVPLSSPTGRERLTNGPLVRFGLLEVDDLERPFPSRALRVPDRVVGHLLGSDAPDPIVAPVLLKGPRVAWGDGTRLARALSAGARLAYLREPATGSGDLVAMDAVGRAGLAALRVDLTVLAAAPDRSQIAAALAREARLTNAAIVASPASALEQHPELVEALRPDPLPFLLVGTTPWDPTWSHLLPVLVEVDGSTLDERGALWRNALAHHPLDFDPGFATSQFLLRPTQIARAAAMADLQSSMDDASSLTEEHVRAGARAENGSALQRLARRVDPRVGWEDLVLPLAARTALQEVAARARHRERVLGEWSMRPGGGRGYGVVALFSGDSGTGKTMSAEVVAGDLGLDLYVVDLATVVDKYVGETEKNLDRIFNAASGVNGVLLFDEADAVFGKRSEVKDAHDRYANVESAFLLQRMESFDGLAILATNLRANIDEAFTRRLDVVVDFPQPDAGQRLALWTSALAPLPHSEELALDFCADSFELTGGAIRSAAITAAYLAANADGAVTMAHVVMAVQREYRKLGRLCVEQEFGRYHGMLV